MTFKIFLFLLGVVVSYFTFRKAKSKPELSVPPSLQKPGASDD